MRKLLYSPWQTFGVPSVLIPIGQLHQSPPSPVLGYCYYSNNNTIVIIIVIIIRVIEVSIPKSTTNIHIHHFKTTFMCPRSSTGVPFDSVGILWTNLLLCTTCMRSCFYWSASCVTARQTQNTWPNGPTSLGPTRCSSRSTRPWQWHVRLGWSRPKSRQSLTHDDPMIMKLVHFRHFWQDPMIA